MTYSEFIAMVSREVLDRRAWPNDGTKLQEQVDLSYVAGLAVACELPLSSFNLATTNMSATEIGGTGVYQGDLPGNLFTERDDLGVHNFIIGGIPRYAHEQLPVQSVFKAGANLIQSGQKFFAIDISGRKLFTSGNNTMAVVHFPTPSKPAVGAVGTQDYFLPEKHSQRAVHIVASHLSGSRIRDNAAASFQSMLGQFYSKS